MDYIHGGDIYRNQVELDYSTNLNPLGMPSQVKEAAKAGVELSIYYPDARGEALLRAISEKEKVKEEFIFAGNGAAELIYALAYARRPSSALLVTPAFKEYEASLKQIGCSLKYHFLKEKHNFCIEEEFLDDLEPSIEAVYLCNPNNPTGHLIDKELMKAILDTCKKNGTMLAVDECFMDFVAVSKAYSMKKYLEDYDNLLILKAFTKIYAMPGLRLGYVMASNLDLLSKMKKSLQPWNTSLPAQMAGIAALKEKEYMIKTRQVVERERMYLWKEMDNGLADHIYGGSGNFIFFRGPEDLYNRLLEKRILIRDCSNFGLPKGFYRICVKKHWQNMKLIHTWRQITN